MPHTFSYPLFLSFFLLLSSCSGGRRGKWETAEVTGMFVFGSSLVDNGNNNYVRNSSARADFLPYGIDFRSGPSGRFSNGRNPVDVLGQLLKLPRLLPPSSDPRTEGKRILHGVNFASGGSGILDQTGALSGGVISLSQQVRNFENVTLPELRAQQGGNDHWFSSHLSKSLFVIGTGGNDYLLNYFLRSGPTQKISLQDFTRTLITDLSKQLMKLYGLGARKFVVLSVQVMGCIPVVRASLASNGSCMEPLNEAAILFNSQLKSLVHTITPQMPGSNLVFVNSYQIIKSFMDDPKSKGMKETRKACCQTDVVGILCKRGGQTCTDRDAHLFFDGLHPTDIVNAWIAKKAYGSNFDTDVYPFNVSQLASL
ncbi:hypothetical protein MRB53_006676 [Persea americana]|uniref:Uncharacterized protein n=1 Tax=Persea americana TaxID=3435 RepID=A0ACC2MHC5_PERAE|nr:hypothetical protein MRB53_006676 [Persea americana]